jgi:hypothetical protein
VLYTETCGLECGAPMIGDVTPEKARILARLYGDGYVKPNPHWQGHGDWRLEYSNVDERKRNEFKNDIRKVYGPVHFIEGETKSGFKLGNKTPRVIVKKKIIWLDLQRYVPFHSYKWRVPSSLFEASLKARQEFIRTLFLDDGCCTVHKKRSKYKGRVYEHEYPLYIMELKNEGALDDLKKLLSGLGIRSTVRYFKPHQSWVLEVRGRRDVNVFKQFFLNNEF